MNKRIEYKKIDLIETYLKDLEIYGRAQNTIRNSRNILYIFAQNRNILNVGIDDIKIWLKTNSHLSKQTQIKYLESISVFYATLIEEEKYLKKNPCTNILRELRKAPQNPIKKTTEMTVDDIRKIAVQTDNPRDRSIIVLLYKTGMRLNELSSLNIEDVNMTDETIHIRKRKGGKEGWVLFDDECKRMLEVYFILRNKTQKSLYNLSGGRIEIIIKNIGKRAGFDNLKPHDFRYCFTTHLNAIKTRCHPDVIDLLRGDSKKSMRAYYSKFTSQEVKTEYERCIGKIMTL